MIVDLKLHTYFQLLTCINDERTLYPLHNRSRLQRVSEILFWGKASHLFAVGNQNDCAGHEISWFSVLCACSHCACNSAYRGKGVVWNPLSHCPQGKGSHWNSALQLGVYISRVKYIHCSRIILSLSKICRRQNFIFSAGDGCRNYNFYLDTIYRSNIRAKVYARNIYLYK